MLRVFFAIGALQAVAIVLTALRAKLLAVWLGPGGMGVVSMVDQFVQSAAYFSALSLPFAALKFLSRAHSEGEASFRRSYGGFAKAALVLAGGGTLVAAALALVGADWMGEAVARYRGLLLIALLGLPATVLNGFFSHVLAAARQYRASSLLAIVTGAAMLAATLLGLALGGLRGQYLGNALAGTAVALGTLLYLNRSLGLPLYDRAASVTAELRRSPEIVPVSVLMFAAALAYSLSFLVARYAVLKHFGEAEAGLLHAPLAIAVAMGLVLTPVNGLYLTPIMNRSSGREEKLRTVVEFQKHMLVILGVAGVAVALFPQPILALLFSAAFTPSAQFVYLFVIWQCLFQLAGVGQAVLIGLDEVKAYAAITVAGYALLALTAWVAAPRLGVPGVALGFITSGATMLLLALVRLRVKHGFAFPGSLSLLVVYILAAVLLAGLSAGWGLAVVSARLVYYLLFVAGLLLFLSKEERSSLVGLWARGRP